MSDVTIRGVQKDITPPERSARKENKAGASFAKLLRQTSAEQTDVTAQTGIPGRDIASGQALTGQQAAALAAQATARVERLPGESAEHWQRRSISYETGRRWQICSRQWQSESADMDIVDGMVYCSDKATQWVTDLMNKEPAMFREWIGWEQWHSGESGLVNAIVPEGFTMEDYTRWMAKDVLDYL